MPCAYRHPLRASFVALVMIFRHKWYAHCGLSNITNPTKQRGWQAQQQSSTPHSGRKTKARSKPSDESTASPKPAQEPTSPQVSLTGPPSALFDVEEETSHILDLMKPVAGYHSLLPYSEVDAEHWLEPNGLANAYPPSVPRESNVDPETGDAVPSLMTWRDMPSRALIGASSRPTLSHFWVPRWYLRPCERFLTLHARGGTADILGNDFPQKPPTVPESALVDDGDDEFRPVTMASVSRKFALPSTIVEDEDSPEQRQTNDNNRTRLGGGRLCLAEGMQDYNAVASNRGKLARELVAAQEELAKVVDNQDIRDALIGASAWTTDQRQDLK